MQLWIDADAVPRAIRDVIIRAAERLQLRATFVANSPLSLPRSQFVFSVQVPKGFDVADSYVLSHAQPGDLCITQDIPLAAELLPKGIHAINPRGEHYTDSTIRERLNIRDFMDGLRGAGLVTGGPPPLNEQDVRAFASSFDRLLTKLTRELKKDPPSAKT